MKLLTTEEFRAVKHEFNITPSKHIRIFLEHNGNSHGTGINNLIRRNTEKSGVMTAKVLVYKLDGVVDTPIGGIENWSIDTSYKVKTFPFKTAKGFVKISKMVETKLLDIFK